jgi:hypothetical protein
VKTHKEQQRNQHGATASTPTGFQTGASEFQPDCGATIHPNVQRLRRQQFLKQIKHRKKFNPIEKKSIRSKKNQSDRKNKHELECNSSFVACKHQRKRAQDMLGSMHPCCR